LSKLAEKKTIFTTLTKRRHCFMPTNAPLKLRKRHVCCPFPPKITRIQTLVFISFLFLSKRLLFAFQVMCMVWRCFFRFSLVRPGAERIFYRKLPSVRAQSSSIWANLGSCTIMPSSRGVSAIAQLLVSICCCWNVCRATDGSPATNVVR